MIHHQFTSKSYSVAKICGWFKRKLNQVPDCISWLRMWNYVCGTTWALAARCKSTCLVNLMGKYPSFILCNMLTQNQLHSPISNALLPVSFGEDVMDYNIKLVTDKDLNTLNPFFQTQKSKSSLNKGRQWPVSLCIWGALTWLALRFSLGVENAENHNNGKNGTDVKFQSTSSCGVQIPVLWCEPECSLQAWYHLFRGIHFSGVLWSSPDQARDNKHWKPPK